MDYPISKNKQENWIPRSECEGWDLRRVEGAFSLVMMSNDRIFAVRDPRGFRPLAMGRIPAVEGQKRLGRFEIARFGHLPGAMIAWYGHCILGLGFGCLE